MAEIIREIILRPGQSSFIERYADGLPRAREIVLDLVREHCTSCEQYSHSPDRMGCCLPIRMNVLIWIDRDPDEAAKPDGRIIHIGALEPPLFLRVFTLKRYEVLKDGNTLIQFGDPSELLFEEA